MIFSSGVMCFRQSGPNLRWRRGSTSMSGGGTAPQPQSQRRAADTGSSTGAGWRSRAAEDSALRSVVRAETQNGAEVEPTVLNPGLYTASVPSYSEQNMRRIHQRGPTINNVSQTQFHTVCKVSTISKSRKIQRFFNGVWCFLPARQRREIR